MDRHIYVLLMRSNTIVSRLVHLFTGDEYTHAAIGLSPTELYTMTRYDQRYLFPAGLHTEHSYDSYPHVLIAVSVTEVEYAKFCDTLFWCYDRRSLYKFNCIGLLLAYMRIPIPRAGKMFCSEFCSMVLRSAGIYCSPNPDCLVKPMELLNVKGGR